MSLPKCSRRCCFREAVTVEGLCIPCHETYGRSRGAREYSATPRLLAARPAPHVVLSYELETESRSGLVAAHLYAQIHNCATRDASISGLEYKILGPCCGSHAVQYKLVTVAERAKAVGLRVNSRCGLHVHLDRRGVQRDRLRQFFAWCISMQDQFGALCPASRWGSHYVQLYSDPHATANIVRDWCSDLPYTCFDHYRWVNWSRRHETLEFRWHPGTLNPLKLAGYHDFMRHLGHLMRSDREFPALLADVCPSGSLGSEYVAARANAGGSLRISREETGDE